MSEPKLAPSTEGSVVLNVGGELGALLLYVDRALLDHEIDVVPADPTAPRCHSAVRERHVGSARLCVAVYPQLRSGLYTVVGWGQQVEISGGHITEIVYAPEPSTAQS